MKSVALPAAILTIGIVAVAVGLVRSTGSAAGPAAQWSLYERASATAPFVAGATPLDPPNSGSGYEIVSFDAVPLAIGLATYVYGGAELSAALGGPAAPLVSCTADFTTSSMNLHVAGAYPYAGCVFYVGATNIGDDVATVELGSLTADATVTCSGLGCQASDIEMVAGGPNQEAIDALCRFEGGVEPAPGPLLFQLAPEATVVCPWFIALLQPAAEDASYSISVIPPSPEASNANP